MGFGEAGCPAIPVIHLIGPGGAGKSTAAPYVAALLDGSVLDLDRVFEVAHGDIDRFIRVHGYAAYAAANVEIYLERGSRSSAVAALSSGFMTYSADVHPAIAGLQRELAAAPTTVLLLPSLDLEICVAETLRRQAIRPLAIRRSAGREEAVIRKRFAHYRQLTSRVVTTMRPAWVVAREVVAAIKPGAARQRRSCAPDPFPPFSPTAS